MAYPHAPAAPPVRVIRIPVVALVAVAVVAVAGILVWGGGDEPEYSSAGGGADAGSVAPGFASGAGGGSSGAGSDSPAAAGPGATTPPPFLDALDAQPIGGTYIAPTESGALAAWRVAGGWQDQLSAYQSRFPITGYRLGEKRLTTTADDGSDLGGAWDIEPDQSGPQVGAGLLYIGPDPADPTFTIVEIEVY